MGKGYGASWGKGDNQEDPSGEKKKDPQKTLKEWIPLKDQDPGDKIYKKWKQKKKNIS